jgi:hypothetical protein
VADPPPDVTTVREPERLGALRVDADGAEAGTTE